MANLATLIFEYGDMCIAQWYQFHSCCGTLQRTAITSQAKDPSARHRLRGN